MDSVCYQLSKEMQLLYGVHNDTFFKKKHGALVHVAALRIIKNMLCICCYNCVQQ